MGKEYELAVNAKPVAVGRRGGCACLPNLNNGIPLAIKTDIK